MTVSFSELALRPEIQKALIEAGYTTPTPIQSQAIPHVLAGRDLLGIAQTGTGKTAAFTLPILERLSAAPGKPRSGHARVLILTPTRELAIQIGDSVKRYSAGLPLRYTVVFGGVGQQPQVNAMRAGVDILIATPGRLMDLMNQGHIKFDALSVFVLDEADRMLDMGFIHDVRRIVATIPTTRQTLFFSATMPREIADLAAKLLNDPIRVAVTPPATTVERIDQQVIFAEGANKRAVLVGLLADPALSRVIIFTRTKHGANKVAEHLAKANIQASAIHGNKSQTARQQALDGFRAGKLRVLVATDIASRGIDVEGISHVINFELPNVAENYVHRIGRTARAGKDGIAISLCDREERAYLKDIERATKHPITVVEPPAFVQLANVPAGPAIVEDRGPRSDQRHNRPRNGQNQARPHAARGPSSNGANTANANGPRLGAQQPARSDQPRGDFRDRDFRDRGAQPDRNSQPNRSRPPQKARVAGGGQGPRDRRTP